MKNESETRPEREELGWLHNPAAPQREEELEHFIAEDREASLCEMKARLNAHRPHRQPLIAHDLPHRKGGGN